MKQFAIELQDGAFDVPTILIIGTSMSAGKTVTGRRVCEILAQAGLDVVGAKLTGAGRYRDIVSFRAAGAKRVFDFVDVGLPSTVVAEEEFRQAIRPLLRHIGSLRPDYLVAEAGASPLEPYNVGPAMQELGDNVVCILLAASDPYAVVGVEKAFGVRPDLVTGPAANTSAAVALVRKLTGHPAINVIDRNTMPEFAAFLEGKLGRELRVTGPSSPNHHLPITQFPLKGG
jgi:NAD(P)-dependent dehydrogenase (short-subunit alcohol dehydrogenase family)